MNVKRMMRLVLLVVLCGALWAEVRMNIQQLRAFITSSTRLGHSDKQIADYLKDNAQMQLLESERVKDKIRNFEQDMWNY